MLKPDFSSIEELMKLTGFLASVEFLRQQAQAEVTADSQSQTIAMSLFCAGSYAS